MERKVRTGRLKKGMYVSNLDRPWRDTPFLIQGFFIHDDEDLRALNKYCDFVYIETDRGIAADMYWDDEMSLPTNEYLERFLRQRKREVEYTDEHDSATEMPVARTAIENALEKFGHVIEKIKQRQKLDLKLIHSFLDPLMDSILRNPDSMMWLSSLRNKEDYYFSSSVDNCVLAIVFARHMGLPRQDMMNLALGVLLFDIGILNVRDEVLNKKTRLSEDEFVEIKKHVDDGVDYLRLYDGIHEDTINVVLTHHERFDGSGYPNRLSGLHIPVYGRMAAIIDCYEAMTISRPYSDAIAAHTALQKIYNWRNKYFQDELVDAFMRSIGAYPTGSLLEMKSGEVGIVLSQDRVRHMRPTVMLLLDGNKVPYRDFKIVDLVKPADQEEEMQILRGLDPGAYGINPKDFYL